MSNGNDKGEIDKGGADRGGTNKDGTNKGGTDNIVSLQDHVAQSQTVKPPQPDALNSKRIRDLSVKAVIYPQTMTAKEAQELGAAILYHLKQHYAYAD